MLRVALLAALTGALLAPVAATADTAALVQPFAGTERGGTFPGPTLPFGMVQLSPNTEGALGGGYRHSQHQTWGFAMTHLSGPGCAAMGDVVTQPATGPVSSVDLRSREQTLTSQQAAPGAYSTTLAPSGVQADLTATARTGWTRYAFPATWNASVLVQPGADFRGARNAAAFVVGNRTIEGWVDTWGYWGPCPTRGENRYRVYFTMQFSRPFRAYGTGNGTALHRHERIARGADAGAYVLFDTRKDRRPLVAKTGISYVDMAGARRNLATETGDSFDFAKVRDQARTTWNALLDRILVPRTPAAPAETFYTALYHALIHPSVFSDADGRYLGFDDRVHRVTPGHAHFTAYSMWDTYRAAHQVIDLVAPEVVPDLMRSLIADAHEGAWLPKWPYAHFETNQMVGDPAANVLVDAYLKGLLAPGDVNNAWAELVHNASAVPDADERFEGRTGLEGYLDDGFVAFHLDGDLASAASLNLEYAINDCALALMAGRLGHDGERRYLLRRAKRYRYTIDGATGFARPRLASGAWLEPFFVGSRRGFREGSAAPYTWLVPQDVGGLARTLGGRPKARAALDTFLGYDDVVAHAQDANRIWSGGERFTPRNEHDLQAPYTYNYLGEPWKTQDLVGVVRSLFTTAPNGLPGSDDLGTMSSWYVLSALGLFPLMGGDDTYALTTPLFPRAVVDAPHVGPIVITTSGSGHISGVTLDGRALTSSVVPDSVLRGGAHLSLTLGPGQSTWATGNDTPVSACATNPRTADLRLRFLPASRGRLRLRIGNPGDAAARDVRLHVRIAGHSVISRTVSVIDARHAVVLALPADGSGPAHANVEWSGFGDSGGALRVFATGEIR